MANGFTDEEITVEEFVKEYLKEKRETLHKFAESFAPGLVAFPEDKPVKMTRNDWMEQLDVFGQFLELHEEEDESPYIRIELRSDAEKDRKCES